MCRLFAQVSPHPASAREHLVDSPFSLLKQSDFDKTKLQAEGWGIAYIGNHSRPKVSKSAGPAFKEAARFKRAASRAKASVIIGHIRAACDPRGIAVDKLISLENSQPYTHGRLIFTHNGMLEIPDEVARNLGPYRKRIKGNSDSLVYFWQFIKFYETTGSVKAAFQACIQENWALWRECRSRYPKKKAPYTSLNAMVTDGRELHVLAHCASPGMHTISSCTPGLPWGVMNFSRRGDRLLVASENLDRKRWTRLSKSEILSAEIRDGRLKVRRTRFKLSQVKRGRFSSS